MATKKGSSSTSGSLVELIMIVAVALGLALGIQAFLVKPYRIPSESMVPTLQIGQRVLVNRIGERFTHPDVGDVVVFHPPAGAEQDNTCGSGQPPAGHAVRQADRTSAPTSTSSSASSPARATGSAIEDGHVVLNGKRPDGAFAQPVRRRTKAAISRPRSRFRPATTS